MVAWRTLVTAFVALTFYVGPAYCTPGSGNELAYVTTEQRSMVAVIDTTIDAVIDQISLSLGRSAVAVSSDGSVAYVVDTEGDAVTAIDVASGGVLLRIPVGNAPSRIGLSADGRIAYVNGVPSVRIDLVEGTISAPPQLPLAPDLAVSQDGSRAFFGGNGLTVVDTTSQEAMTFVSQFHVAGLALSSDERSVYLVGAEAGPLPDVPRLLVIDAATGAVTVDFPVSQSTADAVDRVAVAPDALTLYMTGRFIGAVLVVDASTRRVRRRIPLQGGPHELILSADGARLFVSGTRGDALVVINTTTDAVESTITVGRNTQGMTLSGDGKLLFVAAADGVHVLDVETGVETHKAPAAQNPTEIVATADGRTLYVAGEGSGSVAVIDAEQRMMVASVTTGGAPFRVALTPDERRLYVTSFASDQGMGTVFAIDTASNTVVNEIAVAGATDGIAITPDGRRAFVSHYLNDFISCIDLERNEVIYQLRVGADPKGIAISRDGRFGMVGTEAPAMLHFFDPSRLTQPDPATTGRIPVQGGSAPCAIALSQDGMRAYAADVRISGVYKLDTLHQSVARQAEIATAYSANACGIALTPDERRLYVANNANWMITVLDAGTLDIMHHIPVGPRPYDVTFACIGGCASPLPTATLPATRTPTASPTPLPCAGDCDGDGAITIAEVVRGVGIALARAPMAACNPFDTDADGRVEVAELVAAVVATLQGCGSESLR